MQTRDLCKQHTTGYEPANIGLLQRHIGNANSILAESRGCGAVKNVILQSMETAYKLLRATKPILPIHRGKAPPMEILVNSRLIPAKCDDCTNTNCILTKS